MQKKTVKITSKFGPRKCPKCGKVVKGGEGICPSCGTVIPTY